MKKEPKPEWWPRTYVEVARELECSAYSHHDLICSPAEEIFSLSQPTAD